MPESDRSFPGFQLFQLDRLCESKSLLTGTFIPFGLAPDEAETFCHLQCVDEIIALVRKLAEYYRENSALCRTVRQTNMRKHDPSLRTIYRVSFLLCFYVPISPGDIRIECVMQCLSGT